MAQQPRIIYVAPPKTYVDRLNDIEATIRRLDKMPIAPWKIAEWLDRLNDTLHRVHSMNPDTNDDHVITAAQLLKITCRELKTKLTDEIAPHFQAWFASRPNNAVVWRQNNTSIVHEWFQERLITNNAYLNRQFISDPTKFKQRADETVENFLYRIECMVPMIPNSTYLDMVVAAQYGFRNTNVSRRIGLALIAQTLPDLFSTPAKILTKIQTWDNATTPRISTINRNHETNNDVPNCYRCDRPGHTSVKCLTPSADLPKLVEVFKTKRQQNPNFNPVTDHKYGPKPKHGRPCTRCHNIGHYPSFCLIDAPTKPPQESNRVSTIRAFPTTTNRTGHVNSVNADETLVCSLLDIPQPTPEPVEMICSLVDSPPTTYTLENAPCSLMDTHPIEDDTGIISDDEIPDSYDQDAQFAVNETDLIAVNENPAPTAVAEIKTIIADETPRKIPYAIDNGSQAEIFPKQLADQLHIDYSEPPTQHFTAVNNENLSTIGQFRSTLRFGDTQYTVKFYVTENYDGLPILGRTALHHLDLQEHYRTSILKHVPTATEFLLQPRDQYVPWNPGGFTRQ